MSIQTDNQLTSTEDIKARILSIQNKREMLCSMKPSKYHDVFEKRQKQIAKLTERESKLYKRSNK